MTSLTDGYLRALQDLLPATAVPVRCPRRYRRIKLFLIALLIVNACLYVIIFSGHKEVVVGRGERQQVSTSSKPRDDAVGATRGLRQQVPCANNVAVNSKNVLKNILRNHGNITSKERGQAQLCKNTTEKKSAVAKMPLKKSLFRRFLDWFRDGFDDGNTSQRKSLSASHDYTLVLNEPDVCRTKGDNESSVFLLVCVFTVHANFEKRQAIRDTWGSQQLIGDKRIVTLFMLGKTNDKYHQKLVELESKKYGDIIMEDFVDSYHNLTLKTIMSMKWTSQYCSNTAYVMKTDDDMFVNYEGLLTLLTNPKTPKTNFYVGNKFSGNAPIRNPRSKWYVPKKMYPNSRYPSFCSGTGYVMSGDIPARAYTMSLRTRYLYLEDVYMGLCLKKLNIKMSGHAGFHIDNEPYKYCSYKRLITSHGKTPTEMHRIWEDQRSRGKTKCVNIKI